MPPPPPPPPPPSLSLSLQDLFVDHDPTPVYRATRAIAKLQALFGVIPKIYGKGRNAKVMANAVSQAVLAIQQNDIAHCI